MSIVRRTLLNLAIVLSALLCMATVALWVRSYYSYDFLTCEGRERGYVLYAVQGKIGGFWLLPTQLSSPVAERPHWKFFPLRSDSLPGPDYAAGMAVKPGDPWWKHFGFDLSYLRFGSMALTWMAPYWFLGMIFMVLPAAWARRTFWHFTNDGRCAACQYDLTGNASGVCPECGAVIKEQAETNALNAAHHWRSNAGMGTQTTGDENEKEVRVGWGA
jgi:hypothetical protein